MKRINGERITLVFAKLSDKRLVYDMLVAEEVKDFMFNEQHPAPTWEEFEKEEDEFYSCKDLSNGSYLLIEYKGNIVGSISYACGYSKKNYAEMDIWMGSKKNMGKGLGTEAICLLREFVHKNYFINDFIIRPWAKNVIAIKAYNKCGFYEEPTFNIKDYYSNEDLKEYGDGDYGKDETINLIMRYE